MNLIDIITDNPSQTMTLRSESGQNILLNLRYSYNQSGWFYDLTYGSFTLKGRRATAALNLLRAFKNIIPFGLALFTTDRNEPIFISDFKEQRATLYILNQEDIDRVETLLEGV